MGLALVVTDQDSTAGPASTARHESNDANEGDNGSAPLAVVTGASGFIGSYLCPALKQAGYRVLAVTRPGSGITTAGDGIDELRTCSLQQASLAEAFAGAAVVFHLAGIAHTGVRNKALLREVNVQGTREVVRAAQAAKVGKLVYFSSVLAGRPGQSAYAESKQQAEELVLAASGPQLSSVVLRPVNVYGIGMRGNLLTMAKLIAAGRLPPLPRLENRLALVSVQDLCRAAIMAAAAPLVAAAPLSGAAPLAAAGKVYTVSDGQTYTPTDIEAAIYRALGRNKPAWRTPRMLFFAAAAAAELAGRMGLIRSGFGLASYNNLVTDNPVSRQELTDDTGYQPTLNLYDILPDILEPLR